MARLHEMGCSSRLATDAACDCDLQFLTPDVERVIQRGRAPLPDLTTLVADLLGLQIAVFDAHKVMLQHLEAAVTADQAVAEAQGQLLRKLEDVATILTLSEPSHEQ